MLTRQMASGRYMQPSMYGPAFDTAQAGNESLTVNELAALIAAERHHHKLEKSDEASSISTIGC
jgi:hypothetical protein